MDSIANIKRVLIEVGKGGSAPDRTVPRNTYYVLINVAIVRALPAR